MKTIGRVFSFQRKQGRSPQRGTGNAKVLPDGPQHANGETWRFELIRVPGFGRYRKPTVGIGRLRNFRVANCDFRMGNGTAKVLLDGLQYVKGGTGWFRFGVGMKGKVAVSGSYRQLMALQKNDFVMEQAGCFDNLLAVPN
jgi:hypothetical protein